MLIGRPPKYQTAEQMQHAIDLYFLACKAHQKGEHDLFDGLSDEDMKIINSVDDMYPSVTGMAILLGFTSRNALLNYEEKDEFIGTIKAAKLRIENAIEQRLFFQNATGSIFNLKNNYGWVDKTEQDVTSKGEQIRDATTHILGLLPTEALEKALEDAKGVTNNPVNSDDNTTE
jgi:hypothetical protein